MGNFMYHACVSWVTVTITKGDDGLLHSTFERCLGHFDTNLIQIFFFAACRCIINNKNNQEKEKKSIS